MVKDRHIFRGLILVSLLCLPHVLSAAEPVRVQLKWLHQFQFAGYYAAIEQGYYQKAGLDVSLIEGAPGVDPAKVVLAGGAEYGVGTPELLLARAAGAPLVVLGVIFQHSPYVFLALEGHGISDIAGLAGRRVMIEPQAAELYAYLLHEHIDRGTLQVLPHTFSAQDLAAGKVDAMSAYATDEPFTLHHEGRSYLSFNPRAGGVDFYGDCFFTTEKEIREHPMRVKAFRDATLAGWDYALKHPEEVIDLLVTKYHSAKSRDALRFEAAQMRELMHPEIIPIGYMYKGRWRHIMETYEELGMLDHPVDLDGFLYDPHPKPDYTIFYWITGSALTLAFGTFGILLPVLRFNRRLKQEIADRVKAEKLLEEARDTALRASQAKMEFLTQITHDLRTPVSSIIMQTELMELDADAARKEELGVIRDAGQHLLDLVNDLLDMHRLEAGQIELEDEPFTLEEVLDPVVEVLGVAARRKGIVFTSDIEAGLPALHGDAARLRQILFNLAGNAVKFTDHGRVEIRVRRDDPRWLRLEIADTGIGIPAADLEHIFEPLGRSSLRHSHAKEGTGLGLAIVHRLVEAMDGKVAVQSDVGQGSTFTLDLPLLGAPSRPAARGEEVAS